MAKREIWGSRAGFILAAVGSAIGLGNIWRFPYKVYSNGGGAFLIPYFFALLTAGIPLLILEYGMGHRFRGGAPSTFARLSKEHNGIRNWEWLGWFQVLIAAVISVYYIAVIAWAIAYVYYSATVAWGESSQEFFFSTVLKLETQGFLDNTQQINLGGLNTGLLLPFLIAWGVVWVVLYRGIKKGIEKISKIFMPLLLLLVLILLFRSVSLEGAAVGLDFLFKPDFSKLTDVSVWVAAYGQIFFSLSICFAIMIGYSSYLPKESDIVNNGFITGFLNCGFSMLAGIVIFSILGYMAQSQNMEISEVAGGGVGLAFITIPTAISLMPLAGFFGILFFLSLTVAGLSSEISILEAVIAGFRDKFDIKRTTMVNIVCGIIFLLSLLFVTRAGLLLLDIVDHWINEFGIVIAGLLEMILLTWFLKTQFLIDHINPISDFKVGKIWLICLSVVTPVIIGYSVIALFGIRIGAGVDSVLAKINGLEKTTEAGLSYTFSEGFATYEGYGTRVLFLFGWLIIIGIIVCSFILKKIKGHSSHHAIPEHD